MAFLPAAETLLDCLTDAVADLTSPPMVVGMRYGNEVAFDLSQNEDLCCEGLAWVRMGTATPGFPDADTGVVRSCIIASWSLQLEVGIVRCAPVGSDQHIPTEAEHAATAAALAEDFMALRRTICCFHTDGGYAYTVGAWTPVGPAGGCVGSSIIITVEIIPLDVFPV